MHIILAFTVFVFFVIGFVSYPRSPWVTLIWSALALVVCAAAFTLPIYLLKRPYGDGQIVMVVVMSIPFVVITALLFAFYGRFARSKIGYLRWLSILTVATPLIVVSWWMSPFYAMMQNAAVKNIELEFDGNDLLSGVKQCKQRFNWDLNYQDFCITTLANRWLDPSSPQCLERITRIRDLLSSEVKNTQYLNWANESNCLWRWNQEKPGDGRP